MAKVRIGIAVCPDRAGAGGGLWLGTNPAVCRAFHPA
jgi:hypothetical protein